MKICGIYGIRNIVTNNLYIGQSIDIKRRREVHFSALKHGRHENLHLQRSFLKHGANNFKFIILEKTTPDMLDAKEREWISNHQSIVGNRGYNQETGGRKNKNPSPETRAKMSRIRKGRPAPWFKGKHLSVEHRLKLAEVLGGFNHPNYGKHHSAETRRKISESISHYMKSPEVRKKISETNMGKIPWNYGKRGVKNKWHSKNQLELDLK